jgi:hypothetical protein
MRVLVAIAAVALLSGTATPAQEVRLLDRELTPVRVEGRTLVETARLLEVASGARITLAPALKACADSDRPGCDWRIHLSWDGPGQTLASALTTLCRSTRLSYEVVDGAIVISRRAPRVQ